MDYKAAIIQLLDKFGDENTLQRIYKFIERLYCTIKG